MADSDSNSSSFGDITDTDDFQEHLLVLKAKWKAALKKNKKLLLKCPNYDKCQSKCGSVGGMQYHYERCTGNAPRFKCDQCGRTYESRTGLNYHMASSHMSEPIEDSRGDGSSRPQRSTALNTMSAIHISNNPPPLKQSPTRTPSTPPKPSPPQKTMPPDTPTTPVKDIREQHTTPKHLKVSPLSPMTEGSLESPLSTKSPVKKSPPAAKVSSKSEGESKGKKAAKYVTIPSIEYPDEYKSYLPQWRHEMKENKVIKCPNYKDCDFKCTTVNGMKYHFVRCKKANPPEFNCELCGKKFQCRTGLVWHLKKTHKLIDIQPSKGGGFKGTLPANLKVHHYTPPDLNVVPRKKKKLDEGAVGRENYSPLDHKFERSFSRRKSYTPQKMPEEILQNVLMLRAFPSPKLGPRATKFLVPLLEYHIFDNIPTDGAHIPRTVIQLSEEALTWQRLSSDSESEGDYNPEMIYDDDGFGGYRSSNSNSDSDDDYMFGGSKKKVKPKPNGASVGTRGSKRARTLKQEVKDEMFEPVPLESMSTYGESLPPSLVPEEDKETVLPQIPALIKTPDAAVPLEPYTKSFYTVGKDLGHVQPPPGLIMPTKSENSMRHSTKLPEPPPLLKNSETSDLPDVYPHIVLPPSTVQQSWSSSQSSTQSSTTSIATHKRPGRPPKNKMGGKELGGKKATTVRLGPAGSHQKSSRGAKGSYSSKGMKMTRYEFQSSSAATDHTITDTTTTQAGMASYASAPVQNLVSPVQIIQGVPSAPVQMQTYQTVQPGGMVLMQGVQQVSPQYITQDGQTYQIVQSPHLSMADAVDNSQKVSVIMQPSAGYTTKTGAGGIQYITQLDGPPPVPKTTEKGDKSSLKSKFEEARRQEQAKIGLSSEASVPASNPHRASPGKSTSWDSFGVQTGETSSEGKMSEKLKLYLEKEGARKPKQTAERKGASKPSSKGSKGRRSRSVSHDSPSPISDKSTRSRLIVSPSLFSMPSGIERMNEPSGMSIESEEHGNETAKTPTSRPRSKSPTKHRATPDLATLFQPDNITCTNAHSSEMNTEFNFNHSNSNDAESISSSGSKGTGDTSKAKLGKRKRETATEAESTSKVEATKATGKPPTGESLSSSVKKLKTQEQSSTEEQQSTEQAVILMEVDTDPSSALAEGELITMPQTPTVPKKRGPGRPKKNKSPSLATPEQQASDVSMASSTPPEKLVPKRRGPGRPKKSKSPSLASEQNVSTMDVDPSSASAEEVPEKRRTGRSKTIASEKNASVDVNPSSAPLEKVAPKKTGRGRRKKDASEPGPSAAKQYPCDKCEDVYTSKKRLQYHIDTAHGIDANTPLQDCLPVWKRNLKISKHIICLKCGSYKAISTAAMRYHWARCGKQEEDFTVKCPQCNKVYMSNAGLKYHLKSVHSTPPPYESKSPTLFPEVTLDPSQPLPLRRAAAKASEKLSELASSIAPALATATSPSERKTVVLTTSPLPQVKQEGSLKVPPELSQALLNKQEVQCPIEGCTKVFSTLGGLKYHLAHHTGQVNYRCPVCASILLGSKRFENHLNSKHPDVTVREQNLTDHEYTPEKEPAEESDHEIHEDWEAEKEEQKPPPRIRKPTLRVAQWIHNAPKTYKEYQSKVREVWVGLYGGRKVLSEDDWKVKGQDWKLLPKSDLKSYLPELTKSLPFAVHCKKSEDIPTNTLPLFSACNMCDGVRGAVMFAGGPVWCADWMPVEEGITEHYLALTAYKTMDEIYQIKTPFSQPGLIQLWRVESLSNEQEHPSVPQFSLGLAHDYGVLRDMKWCPSVTSRPEGRLGVLAVACTDGAIRIIVFPKPEELARELTKGKKKHGTSGNLVVRLEKEAATLVPSGIGKSEWSDFGQCLCLDWLPSGKYSRIAGGFSNGVVCVWDLETSHRTLPALFSRRNEGLVIHPIAQLAAHKAPCRTVTWCPHDHNILFTGGYDRFGSLWDLRQPYAPLEKQEKGMLVSSKWPLLWNEVLFYCDNTIGAYTNSPVFSLCFLHPPSGQRPIKNILNCGAPVSSISYCPWSDRVAASSFGGELCVCALSSTSHLTNMIYKEKTRGAKTFRNEILWSSYKEPLTPPDTPPPDTLSMLELLETHKLVSGPVSNVSEESTWSLDDAPIQATTKLAWSPNESSHEWILLGSNSGLVQLLHIQAPSQKPISAQLSSQCYQSKVC